MFDKDELNKLYRYALSLTRQEDIAYDLLQGAVEKYLKKPAQGLRSHNIDKPQAYVKTIIRNLYFDLEPHNKVIPMVSMENEEVAHIEPIDDSAMEDLLIYQQDVTLLTEKLSAEENELLYLWAVEERSAKEIANIYQQPRGTILSKLHRLKKRIRKHAQLLNQLRKNNE